MYTQNSHNVIYFFKVRDHSQLELVGVGVGVGVGGLALGNSQYYSARGPDGSVVRDKW